MGGDKAQTLVAGQPLIAHVANAVGPLANPLLLVGGTTDLVDLVDPPGQVLVEWVPDEHPGHGPLGGVLTALHATSATHADFVATVACDLVHLDTGLLAQLLVAARATNADVSVPLVEGHRQWHLAVWNRQSTATLERAFERGVRSIYRAGLELRETVLVPSGPAFVDLDTPDDVAAFERLT